MEAEAEKRKQEELQRQQEEYLEKYEKAENAILMQDYNTAVELLENLPENFKDKEYVLVYAKYCKSVADGETIHTQYRITWELPHEGDMYTGDFAEEMKIARETAAKENEAEERRLKKEKEKNLRSVLKQRRNTAHKMQKSTQRGQPLMKYQIPNLLEKITSRLEKE